MRVRSSIFAISLIAASIFASAPRLYSQDQLAPGTIIPVVLQTSHDTRKSKVGDRVLAEVAQDVPLGNGHVILTGSKVLGTVTQVKSSQDAAKLAFRFNQIEIQGRQIKIGAQVRAIASSLELASAREPKSSFAEASSTRTTWQVGGDSVYGAAGPVEDRSNRIVGKAVRGGVLDEIVSTCEGSAPVNSQPQALWLFSSNACGAYGFRNVRVWNEGSKSGDRQSVFLIDTPEKAGLLRRGVKAPRLQLTRGSGILLIVTD